MLYKKISMLVLSSVLSTSMMVGCNNNDNNIDNQVQGQQVTIIKEEIEVDDTIGGKYLSTNEISDEEIIAKTNGYWYCDTQSFIRGYRESYSYRDGKDGYASYSNKEQELCDILDSVTKDKDDYEDTIMIWIDSNYGQLLRYIDYLERNNQTNSECYKLAIEVREIYNGEIIDIEYFNRAKEILFTEHPNTNWYQDEQTKVVEDKIQEAVEKVEEPLEYSKEEIRGMMNEVNLISTRVHSAKRSNSYVDMTDEMNQLDAIYQKAEVENNKHLFKNVDVACAYSAIMSKIEILKQIIPCYDQSEYDALSLQEAQHGAYFNEAMNNLE